MRNPLLAYWFISAQRRVNGNAESYHFRTFTTGRWVSPEDAIKSIMEDIAEDQGFSADELYVSACNRI